MMAGSSGAEMKGCCTEAGTRLLHRTPSARRWRAACVAALGCLRCVARRTSLLSSTPRTLHPQACPPHPFGLSPLHSAPPTPLWLFAGMFALRERRIHVTQDDFEMAVVKVMKKDTDKNMSIKKLWK